MKQAVKNRLSREYILESAVSIFSQNDYEDVSLNAFCRTYDISKGKFYHYFSSKEEVFYSCINFALDRLKKDMFDYEIKKDASLSDSFHDYYEGRIHYWTEHPYDLLIIKKALDTFTKEEYSYIKTSHSEVRRAMRVKTMEIIEQKKLSSKISVEDLYEVMQLVYERTFMQYIRKIIIALQNGEITRAYERKAELLDMYDKLIYIMLYGILSE